MSSSPSGSCAKCGKHTSLQCAGCKGAPEYFPGDVKSIFYCSTACQRAHRMIHKPDCMSMTRRKKLLRTAIVAKEAFLVYRAVEYDLELSKIERRGETLYLSDNQKNLDIPPRRGPFPGHLTANPVYREAALTWFQCNAAHALSSRLINKLLTDVPCAIEMFLLRIGKPHFITQVIPGPDSPNIPSLDASTMPHSVLKVDLQLSSFTESWIVDLTGAQYGFQEVLVPFLKYTENKECELAGPPESFDLTQTHDLNILIEEYPSGVRRAIACAERPARLRFAAFVDTIDKKILEGSLGEFENKLSVFRLALRQHMSNNTQRV
ncbi:hypothetical protein AnigIFM62618_002623 [Aspergillus niger]|nr:hypothetical protein AnigIFM62618_002623 [Aspergillus niger]